jgi:hypothetical protein
MLLNQDISGLDPILVNAAEPGHLGNKLHNTYLVLKLFDISIYFIICEDWNHVSWSSATETIF